MSVFRFSNGFLAPQIQAVSRAAFSKLNTRQLSPSSTLSIPMAPLLPLIVSGGALLYQQGSDSRHKGAEASLWQKVLAESALGYALLRTTSGVYPLLGIGLGAYRAGRKESLHEKIQALTNTAITMTMGWAGVHLFESLSEAGRENDDYIIHNALQGKGRHEARFKQWIDTRLEDLSQKNENAAGLKSALTRLRLALGDKAELFKKGAGKPDEEQVSTARDKVMALKSEATEWFAKLGNIPCADREQKVIVQAALEKINESQSAFTRMNRMLNPIYGYIIVGLMLGAPLANWITSWIGRRHPELVEKSFHQSLFPQENRILNEDDEGGGGGGHHGAGGLSGHAAHFSSPGPYMVWPDVNGGKPMQ